MLSVNNAIFYRPKVLYTQQVLGVVSCLKGCICSPSCVQVPIHIMHVYTVLWEVLYMWQSRVEIEGYSVVYFNDIAVFEAPYR